MKHGKDQRIVLAYFCLSLAFGMAMGFVFPVYAGFFVEFKSPDHQLVFTAGCIVAGILVGLVSFVIGNATVLRVIRVISARFQELCDTEGDLSRDIEIRSSDAIGALVANFNRFQQKLREIVAGLKDLADQVQRVSFTLSSAAEESAASIEQMSATTGQVEKVAEAQQKKTSEAEGEIARMVQNIAQSDELTHGMASQFFLFSQSMEANRRRIQATAGEARMAGDLSESLTRTGADGEKTLEALRQSIGSVARQTQEIQEIVRFILDISDRTNLLAMNAAIEAAHAGQTGRGFAVVADEIRKLAETSSRQAQNIQSLGTGIAEAAGLTLTRSEATSQSFQTLRRDIESVRNATRAIVVQTGQQEEEDTKLSEGLAEFARFYADLSASMAVQVDQSQIVRQALSSLENASREISLSMREQSLGMEQATEAVVQVRDTAATVSLVVDGLADQTRKFKLEEHHG